MPFEFCLLFFFFLSVSGTFRDREVDCSPVFRHCPLPPTLCLWQILIFRTWMKRLWAASTHCLKECHSPCSFLLVFSWILTRSHVNQRGKKEKKKITPKKTSLCSYRNHMTHSPLTFMTDGVINLRTITQNITFKYDDVQLKIKNPNIEPPKSI